MIEKTKFLTVNDDKNMKLEELFSKKDMPNEFEQND